MIAVGGTMLPMLVASLAGYAFAWLEFPGRDWLFLVVIALLVVPLQMALIPIFSLYATLGHLRHDARPDPLPHGVRAALRDLPAAQLLHRASRRTCSRRRAWTARRSCGSSCGLMLPLGLPAIASLAIFQFLWTWNDLLVALIVRRATRSRSPSRSSPSYGSSARTSS